LRLQTYVLKHFSQESPVASHTQRAKRKRANRLQNAGRKRKTRESKKSTPSTAELFAGCGEPGKPAPAKR
jgi:hypothetical protein